MGLGMDSWYVLKMRNVPTRFNLSENAKVMLQTLEDYRVGAIDEFEIGRMLRLSAEKRKSISDTIRKCASLMEKKPAEMKTCILVIEMCTEILDIAIDFYTTDRPPPLPGFPFMKLPREIRARILGIIIDKQSPAGKLIPARYTNCNCANPEKLSLGSMPTAQKELFKILGSSLGDEFFEVVYRNKTFYFACCCTLLAQLMTNKNLFNHLRKAHVHWCGPKSAEAFRQLAKCPNLQDLTIKISKATTATLNKREKDLVTHFPLNYKNRRMMDSLGADELLAIRGLQEVDVQHISSTQRVQLTEFERQGLRSVLEANVKQPKGNN
ncbi:hypothetical protein EsH8_IV_000589 [Colletotrichum jinshuiense]